MIPFLVCGSLYIYMMLPDKPWWALFWYPLGQAHCGYWFLLVLFEFFVLFSICQIITRFLTKNLCGRHFILVALTIELVLALIYLMCQIGIVCQEPLYTIVSFVKLFYHFPFFVMGFLMRKHNCLETMFNKKTYSISSITFVCLYTMINKCDIHLLPLQWVLALLAVIAIVSFFLSIEYSSSPSKIVNYVGRHTMEIYVLHYFFIPRNMNFLRSIIMPDNLPDVNIILELIINSCIACAIIAVTLCFSFLINNNTYVKQLFFGIK